MDKKIIGVIIGILLVTTVFAISSSLQLTSRGNEVMVVEGEQTCMERCPQCINGCKRMMDSPKFDFKCICMPK